jgi:hypothetical protein
MIFPERVFGRSSAQISRFGRANLPIRCATWSRISCSRRWSPIWSPCSVTKAQIAWPVSSSAWPMTAASATFSNDTIADSSSAVDRR